RLVFDDDEIFVMNRCAHDPPLRGGSPLRDARLLRDVPPGASGLVVGCKTAIVEKALRTALAGPDASRTELVLCRGLAARVGIAGRRTQYRRIARVAGHSLLRVTVRGDRDARIESDLYRIGHPVIGDAPHGH